MPQHVKIIFLEDDLEEWELIKEALEKYHIDMECVTFYQRAIEMLAKLPTEPGQVVVVDYQLKNDVINGDQVIKDARAICEDNYFIIVTQHASEEAMISFIKNKADDFFNKDEPNYHDRLVEGIVLGRQYVKKRNDRTRNLKEFESWLRERAKKLEETIKNIKPISDDNSRTDRAY